MSIQDAIKALDETEIFPVRSSWEGEETPRYAYLSREVAQFMWEPDDSDLSLARRAKGLVDDFVEGGHISVGWRPHDKGVCIMARVDSPHPDYEIWDFRLTPKPGVRILGGFVEKDEFLCLTWDYRDNFEDQWPQQIGRCIFAWQRLFGSELPFQRAHVDEYLSQPFEVV